jgi:phenylacetate-CoA ligase
MNPLRTALFWMSNRTYLNALRRLHKASHMSRSDFNNLQNKRLLSLLNVAATHCPYYKDALTSCGVINSQGTIQLKNFHKIPVLTKETIRREGDRLINQHVSRNKWYDNYSGGSTGEPIRIIQDQNYLAYNIAVKLLFDKWSGYRGGDKRLKLWAAHADLHHARSWREQLHEWAQNTVILAPSHMADQDIEKYLNIHNSLKPRQVIGYSNCVFELAHYAQDRGLVLFAPQSVMTSAGTLHTYMEEEIAAAFQCKVFNRYGSREVGDVACTCPTCHELHIAAFTHYVEVLDPNGQPTKAGDIGEIHVTVLTNHAMPLIRYRIGDLAIPSDKTCDCGIPWPLLSEIKGRDFEMFKTRSGKRIHGSMLHFAFLRKTWVRRFQAIQSSIEEMEVNIELTDPTMAPELLKRLTMELSEAIEVEFFSEIKVKICIVEEIKLTKTGKLIQTICRV